MTREETVMHEDLELVSHRVSGEPRLSVKAEATGEGWHIERGGCCLRDEVGSLNVRER